MCFSFAVATAKDIQTIMICRFFSGFVGSAAFVVSPAIFSDLFLTEQRGTAISTFAGVLLVVPCLPRYLVVSRLKTLVWAGDGQLIFVV